MWFTPHSALVGAVVTRRAQSLDWLWSLLPPCLVLLFLTRAGGPGHPRKRTQRNQLTGHQITIIGGEGGSQAGSNLRWARTWGQKLCTCVKWLIRISNLLSQQLLLTQTVSRGTQLPFLICIKTSLYKTLLMNKIPTRLAVDRGTSAALTF